MVQLCNGIIYKKKILHANIGKLPTNVLNEKSKVQTSQYMLLLLHYIIFFNVWRRLHICLHLCYCCFNLLKDTQEANNSVDLLCTRVGGWRNVASGNTNNYSAFL